MIEGDLAKPERPHQVAIVVGMGLENDEVGRSPPTLSTLSADAVMVVISDSMTSTGPGGPTPIPIQPRGRVVPDQLLRRDVKAVEFHPGSDTLRKSAILDDHARSLQEIPGFFA